MKSALAGELAFLPSACYNAPMKGTWREKLDMSIDCRHVDVVDGIRGISVLMVLWFHFWQQTWLMPGYPTSWLSFLGIRELTPTHIRWVGYLFVDMMVLISAFCLSLPLARNMLLGESMDEAADFYKKRFARIYPSYLLCVLVSFFLALWEGKYPNASTAVRDLLSHLTFTHMFRADTYVHSTINGALWTVALEVQFYLLFPLLRRLFKRWSGAVYLTLMMLGGGFIYGFALKHTPVSMVVNQLPAFFPVFANGMLAAWLFTFYCTRCKYKRVLGVVFTVLAILAAVWIQKLLVSCYSWREDKQLWQLENRIALSFAFSAFLLSASLAVKPFRWLFSNRAVRFLGSISFNLYMWHQCIMVRLVRMSGYLNGGEVSAAGSQTQWLLTGLGLLISLPVAAAATYLIEKPCQKWIMHGGKQA